MGSRVTFFLVIVSHMVRMASPITISYWFIWMIVRKALEGGILSSKLLGSLSILVTRRLLIMEGGCGIDS